MNHKKIEIIRETDVFGLDKPINQLKSKKRKSNAGFLIITLVILIVFAAAAMYLK